MKKKVLILITKSNWGGAQRYVFDLATGLDKSLFDVEVMAGGNGPLIERLKAAGVTADGGLPVGRDVSFFADIAAAWKLFRIFRKKRPHIVHVNSSKIGGIGCFAARLARVPRIIFTCHGWAFNEDRPLWQKLAIKFLAWLTVVLSHKTIMVSEAARRQIIGWPFIPNKLTMIHNGLTSKAYFSKANARLELSRMSPAIDSFVKDNPESQAIIVGTVAELHPIKGYDLAIRAIRDVVTELQTTGSKAQLLYVICGAGEQKNQLEKLISEFGLSGAVVMLGFVADAVQYIKAFDMFLLPSLSEGLPYVLLEAGISGVPIVATTVGGIPEVVEDMKSGILVQPRNHKELAHAISFMIEHPEERHGYGAALRDTVLNKFSLENMIKQTELEYRK